MMKYYIYVKVVIFISFNTVVVFCLIVWNKEMYWYRTPSAAGNLLKLDYTSAPTLSRILLLGQVVEKSPPGTKTVHRVKSKIYTSYKRRLRRLGE